MAEEDVINVHIPRAQVSLPCADARFPLRGKMFDECSLVKDFDFKKILGRTVPLRINLIFSMEFVNRQYDQCCDPVFRLV